MKRPFAILSFAIVLAVPVAAHSTDRRVWVVNDTSYTMYKFHASNIDRTGWEEDILGRSVLEPGERVRVNIDDGSGACIFDLKAVFSGGQTATRFGYNVCERDTWRIHD